MKKHLTTIITYSVPTITFLILLFYNIFAPYNWLNSDMAAEMMFARKLAEEGHLIATKSWYYSTEFRVLYTQLFMVPLFHLTDNWHLVRLLTNVFTYILMLGSYFYMMKPLPVRKEPVILTSTLLLLPFSETMMTHMQMGNTYMPHVIILFFWVGMYLRICCYTGSGHSVTFVGDHVSTKTDGTFLPLWRKLLLLSCFILLSFICGMSGVRYLLELQVPAVLCAALYWMQGDSFQGYRHAWEEGLTPRFGEHISGDTRLHYLYTAFGAFLVSLLGYLVNALVIARKYIFQTYDSTRFISLGDYFADRFANALGTLLELFGYIPDRSVISLRGIVSICAFIIVGILVYITVRTLKITSDISRFMIQFLMISFGINCFFFIFTGSTMVSRYYIPVFIFCLPALVFYVETESRILDKKLLILILTACLSLGTAKVLYSYLTTDKNDELSAVADFLVSENLSFGYATFWNGNITCELSNGQVSIANIGDPETLTFFTWSSPYDYYEESFGAGQPVFMLLSAGEASQYANSASVKNGNEVYNDGCYVIYTYASKEAFLQLSDSNNQ